MRTIEIKHGNFLLVDDEDYEKYSALPGLSYKRTPEGHTRHPIVTYTEKTGRRSTLVFGESHVPVNGNWFDLRKANVKRRPKYLDPIEQDRVDWMPFGMDYFVFYSGYRTCNSKYWKVTPRGARSGAPPIFASKSYSDVAAFILSRQNPDDPYLLAYNERPQELALRKN